MLLACDACDACDAWERLLLHRAAQANSMRYSSLNTQLARTLIA